MKCKNCIHYNNWMNYCTHYQKSVKYPKNGFWCKGGVLTFKARTRRLIYGFLIVEAVIWLAWIVREVVR